MTFLAFSSIQRVEAEDFEDIVLDINYNHIKYAPPKLRDKDIVRSFAAFVVCFDGDDDDDGDGVPDKWGIPHWIAYEIKRTDPQPGKPFDKPDELITDEDLFEKGIAPEEESYDVPEKLMLENPKSPQLGHVKGLLCTGSHASRLGERAYWNVHTVLNVCPQKKKLNMGIWKDLDQKTLEWADEYGSVWVMTGPIVFNNKPSLWLGKNGEVSVAVPDAFFKILVREVGGYPEVLAFIYPQEGIAYKRTKGYDHTPYLTSVDVIEALTGLDFFPKLAEDTETEIEKVISIRLWE
jgi:endonuclease G